MPWITRGLRNGVVTTSYPRRTDGYLANFRGSIEVRSHSSASAEAASVVGLCPTGAISLRGEQLGVDRGACVLCGRCVESMPEVFQFSPNVETSDVRSALIVPSLAESDELLRVVRRELLTRVGALRRSIHVRHVDAGSDGSDEWEVAALTNPIYDVQRLGIFFTASPRHADVLLVTGVGSAGMVGPLRRTWEAMPEPKLVIAAGVEAISGGLLSEGYASNGGVDSTVPVDVFVPGSPATPFALLHGILLAVGLLSQPRVESSRATSVAKASEQ